MSDNDKIYELFRKNEHKLDEKPSRRAWERIDARLDSHNAKTARPVWFRYGGMVAAVLILVLTATFLTLDNQKNNDQFASNDVAMIETALLDLKDDGNNKNYMRIVAYQNEYKNRASRIVESSIASGDLKPRTNNKKKRKKLPETKEYKDEVIASNDVYVEEEEVSDKYFYEDEAIADFKVDIIEPITGNVADIAKPEALEKEKGKEAVSKEEQNMEVIEELATEDIEVMETVPPSVEKPMPVVAVAPTAPSAATGNGDYDAGMVLDEKVSATKKSKDNKRSEVKYDINTAEDDEYPGIKVEDEEEKSDEGLAEFQWIIGNWKGNINGSTSTEQWTKIDGNTYKGKANVSAGGVSLFSEKMELKNASGGIYLTVSLDSKNKRVAYRMTYNNAEGVVFENNSMDYPKMIILKRNSSNSFSIIMQNGDTKSLNNDQIQYLENRNNIVGEKLIRSLKKTN